METHRIAQGDLFDFLDDRPTHVVMPNMATACGLGYIEADDAGGRFLFGLPQRWAEATCPWCRALGRHTVTAMRHQMHDRQKIVVK